MARSFVWLKSVDSRVGSLVGSGVGSGGAFSCDSSGKKGGASFYRAFDDAGDLNAAEDFQ
jgi:hypothetical protein